MQRSQKRIIFQPSAWMSAIDAVCYGMNRVEGGRRCHIFDIFAHPMFLDENVCLGGIRVDLFLPFGPTEKSI